MNNWEKYKKTIGEYYEDLIKDEDLTYDTCVVLALEKIFKQINDHSAGVFVAIDWLTQEAENPCKDCTGMDWGDCAICENSDNLRKADIQSQSKTRFMRTEHPEGTVVNPLIRYINISNEMQNIKCIDEIDKSTTYILVDNEEGGFIEKPIGEVIQQLGIEVV